MESTPDKLTCGLAFALAVCRGALTDVAAGQPPTPEAAQKILDGTSLQNIVDSLGCNPDDLDWQAELSEEEMAKIRNG